MRQVSRDSIAELLSTTAKPCVSIYQPTHRHHPENQQDPIRYKNLIRDVKTQLHDVDDQDMVAVMVENLEQLSHDEQFWNHRTDGLAVLASPNVFQVFDLQQSVDELAIVADSFHTKPLIRSLYATDRFQVLCITLGEAALYEGNRNSIDRVELIDVPTTIEEALGEELTEPHQTVASYGDGSGGPNSKHGAPAMFHGHGDSKDEMPIDRAKFFRVVDRAILQHHSRPSGLPLLLAALPQHQTHFRQITCNTSLIEAGIEIDPMAISPDKLRELAWQALEPIYEQQLNQSIDQYHAAKAHGRGSDDLPSILSAALAGRVSNLYVSSDHHIAGKIDTTNGIMVPGELANPEIDDVLDDLAELVMSMDGEVIILQNKEMPSQTGVAATYRF